MIDINKITLRIAGRVLLEQASAFLPERGKVGFVGRNGAGKTTLLKTLQGLLPLEDGDVRFIKETEIKYVRQEIEDVSLSPLDYLLRTRTFLDEDYKQERQFEAEISKVLKGLGFSTLSMETPLKELSGGWRMRVMLAEVLIGSPGLLLLDEPTNHLDLEAVLWLKAYLKTYPGTILMVSHDKTLLNDVCTHILHLEDKKLYFYSGNYDNFSRVRSQKLEHLQAAQKKITERKEHLQSFVDRFKAKASKAKQAQSRMKMIEKLDDVYIPLDSSSLNISFPKPSHLPVPLLSVYNVGFGYEENKPILKKISFRIDPGDRIAILGPNGNGKTTLANYIFDGLPFQNGEKSKATHFEVGYFYQHQIDLFDLTKSPVMIVSEKMPKATDLSIRTHLAQFGLESGKAVTPVGNLSGGEKARLNLALICIKNPNLIILDEPTNHLDMDTKEALAEALDDFEGAILTISHDKDFLEKVADQIWVVENGSIQTFDGTLEEYEKQVLLSVKETSKKPAVQKEEKVQEAPKANTQKLEKKLEKLRLDKDILEQKMYNEGFYLLEQNEVASTIKNHENLLAEIQTLEEEWLKNA